MGIADMNFLPYCFLADTNTFFYTHHHAAPPFVRKTFLIMQGSKIAPEMTDMGMNIVIIWTAIIIVEVMQAFRLVSVYGSDALILI